MIDERRRRARVDISSNPITPNFSSIDEMQLHHQAGEYNG